jgi:hypothetical protein
VLSKRSKSD